MKKTIIRISIAILIAACLVSCDKFNSRYYAKYSFDVSDLSSTKATIAGHDENGLQICWEEGDEINVEICSYKSSGELSVDGITKVAPTSTVRGKIVFENGSWVIYENSGKVDGILVGAPSKNGCVTIRYSCDNLGAKLNKDCFFATWFDKIPFTEGLQTVKVTVPAE